MFSGGSPDDNRRIISVADYIQAIDEIGKDIALVNKHIAGVFFCSDMPENTYISTAHLSTTYPRPWKYLTIPPRRSPERNEKDHKEAAYYILVHPEEKRTLFSE